MQYIIYKYQENFQELFSKYPLLEDYLINLPINDHYLKSLRKSIYLNLDFLNQIIFDHLVKRKGYFRQGSIHILENELTKETITLEIKDQHIYLTSPNKNNIFFYIIYHNLKNYVIIEQNL